MGEGKGGNKAGGKRRIVGPMRIREGLRKRKAKKVPKGGGLPQQAWNATGISEASQAGHRAAGPIMHYGDDT